ncbi:hypothetical protein P7K49_016659 [Saguinus oedipus]|uniref:Nucleoside-diphosphate kinase n=1 Tax=Saguinus oedipus TaxID=9490 RepID=A0ABQ9VDH3_SAGOE|nr:hypothetical protein P7K49_016659 [Saguinus oedipus]
MICTPDLVVFLACANQRLKERLLKRAEQQGRPDDNVKATQRRLMNFKQNAAPLVKYFQEKGLIMTEYNLKSEKGKQKHKDKAICSQSGNRHIAKYIIHSPDNNDPPFIQQLSVDMPDHNIVPYPRYHHRHCREYKDDVDPDPICMEFVVQARR